MADLKVYKALWVSRKSHKNFKKLAVIVDKQMDQLFEEGIELLQKKYKKHEQSEK